uniref:Uncharacterized protein MANES_10G051000 n=1 Tax=Rhizophora mucronata TaxID=61149 RepID=A0A2P2KKX8_RHIMU
MIITSIACPRKKTKKKTENKKLKTKLGICLQIKENINQLITNIYSSQYEPSRRFKRGPGGYLTLKNFAETTKRILELPFGDVPRQASNEYSVLLLPSHL